MLSLNQLSAPAAKIIGSVLLTTLLSACGGSSGGSISAGTPNASNENEPTSTASDTINYDGPAARSDLAQRYRSEVWANLARETRCGTCHVVGGEGTTAFADTSDINVAYSQALSRTLLGTSGGESPLAAKVGGGHQCWLTGDNDDLCASQVQGWVDAYFSTEGPQTFLETLGLASVAGQDLSSIRVFYDEAPAGFDSSALYGLTRQYCVDCHSEDGVVRQQSPYFADASPDVAYNALRSVIVVSDAGAGVNAASASSNLTRQVASNHNGVCWPRSPGTPNCSASASEMHSAVVGFIGDELELLDFSDANLVASKTVNLDEDGIVPESGQGRVETNVIAKWEFSTLETGSVAQDTSNREPDMPLTFAGNIERLGSGGVRINSGRLQARVDDSAKLYDRISASGEYTIEAWVVPLNVTQEDARIVTYAGDEMNRNFMLGQNLYDYDFYARSSTTDASGGMPVAMDPDEAAQATLQYVVATYSATEGRKVYVNGALVSVTPDPDGAGTFGSWSRNFVLAVGSSVTDEYQWQGSVRFLAIHDREMQPADIVTNYDIGVGTKYYLLFPISDIDPLIPDESYIVLQVEKFDDTGYLFNEPFFATLDGNATGYSFDLEGMRIGINGQIATAGQAYIRLPEYGTREPMVGVPINASRVTDGSGRQILSVVGTVIALDQGSADRFFLSFDRLGNRENVIVEGVLDASEFVGAAIVGAGPADVGIKTFDEINEALSSLTGINKTNVNVTTTFATVRKQLPVNAGLESFAASQQMAVAQLAVLYCKELVDQESALASSVYFPDFNFDATPTTAFAGGGRDQIISPLLDRLLANTTQSADQVAFADAQTELDGLITTLLGNCSDNSCVPQGTTSSRVNNIVTATCATAYANGMMLIQ
jgi:hypothetical protein